MIITQYVERNGLLHKVDVRVKLLFFSSIVVLSFTTTNPLINISLIFLLIVLSFLSNIAHEFLVKIKKFGMLVLFAGIIWLFLYRFSLFTKSQASSKVILTLGPLVVDEVGISYGILMPTRILVMLLSPLLFLMTTKVKEFIEGLLRLRVPYPVAFTLGLSTQMIYHLGDEYEKIKQSQISRGLDLETKNVFKSIKNHVPLLVPLTVRALEVSEKINIALNLKNFDFKRKPRLKKVRLKKVDYFFVLLSLLLISISLLNVGGVI
ncbi:MAG: energy-coupling factor transporter transmembrane protein EcfT [Candidatus Aenigmarchaeota archaeon]|nr:energy-coupling factor transporter transmembrane protein EcfT [Candidatus Aenigmarchaeota archaeon]